jgi:hypothetical protein
VYDCSIDGSLELWTRLWVSCTDIRVRQRKAKE